MDNETLYATVSQHDTQIKNLERRMADVEEMQKQIVDLTISTKELAMSVKNMTEEQKEQGDRIKALELKPIKLWETIVGTVVTGIVGAILGAIIAMIAR